LPTPSLFCHTFNPHSPFPLKTISLFLSWTTDAGLRSSVIENTKKYWVDGKGRRERRKEREERESGKKEKK
jgi:hypothetical protein